MLPVLHREICGSLELSRNIVRQVNWKIYFLKILWIFFFPFFSLLARVDSVDDAGCFSVALENFIFLIFFFFLMIDINDDLIVFFFLVPRRPKLLMLSHPSIAWSISIFFVIYVELKRWCLFGFLTHGRLHRFLLPFGPLWGQISGEDFDWASTLSSCFVLFGIPSDDKHSWTLPSTSSSEILWHGGFGLLLMTLLLRLLCPSCAFV